MTDPARGQRLRALVYQRWGNAPGWTTDLPAQLGVSKAALMSWLNGSQEPDLASCGRLAEVLAVKRYEVVRVMDGDE